MSHTLTVSDELYSRLEQAARDGGHASIEELLETWQASEAEREQRELVVKKIDELRERMFTTYGEMPDSVELIREDRSR